MLKLGDQEKEIYPYSINKKDNIDRVHIPFEEINDFNDETKLEFIEKCK